MNSLEFIEKSIKRLEVVINVEIEDDFQEYMSYSDDYPEKQELLTNLYKEAERCNQELQILYQIKAELEAWKVVKEDIYYQAIKYCDERPEYTYEHKEWSFQLTEDYPNFEEKSEKLKKALEVENE